MKNSFKPPNTGIKPFNAVSQERQLSDLHRATAPLPNQFVHTAMPHVQPVAPAVVPQMGQPSNFNRLRAMFSGGR